METKGSHWNCTVIDGLMSCSPHGWQKFCLNSGVGDAPYGEQSLCTCSAQEWVVTPVPSTCSVAGRKQPTMTEAEGLNPCFTFHKVRFQQWIWLFLVLGHRFQGGGMGLKCQWGTFIFRSAEHMYVFGERHTSLNGVCWCHGKGPG